MRRQRWNPRPGASYDSLQRTGYLAGYQDGFHGLPFGSGYDDPPPAYRIGWEHAAADREAS